MPLSLAEVIARVEEVPGVISRELQREETEALRDAPESLGAKVELREARASR